MKTVGNISHDNAPNAKKLRSSLPPFNWKKNVCFVVKWLHLILTTQKGHKYIRSVHFLLKTDSLNAAKAEVTHGGWKFKSTFMDVLIWSLLRLYITTITIQDLCK